MDDALPVEVATLRCPRCKARRFVRSDEPRQPGYYCPKACGTMAPMVLVGVAVWEEESDG